ncbi:hypothetical protein IKG64_02910 [Candidatus Saccharibacteria bacterium]|nr:hypothetical protein [Candidatus Saccharibacteria bacterium]
MISIFSGEDRIRANQEIKKRLGADYEIIEGAELTPADLPSIFFGNSLFTHHRRILIRDLSANKNVFDKLPDYLSTPHQIIIFELKLDKRSTTYKTLKDKVEFVDFKPPKDPNFGLVFDIYKTAKSNGPKAINLLARIKFTQDPMMFFGLLVSQAIKDFNQRQGIKEKQALKELAVLDLQLKSTSTDPWLLIESFLLRIQT